MTRQDVRDLERTCTAVFQNLATAEASHMTNMSNQFAPITSAFHFPVARFWKTAVCRYVVDDLMHPPTNTVFDFRGRSKSLK